MDAYRGDDFVKTILQFAKEYRVGNIVIGTPVRKVPFWRRFQGKESTEHFILSSFCWITIAFNQGRNRSFVLYLFWFE